MSQRDELSAIERELDTAVGAAARVALLDRAVELADSCGSPEDGWRLRLQLMSAIYYTGDWDKLLLHFGWCITQHDRDPERFSDYELLWKYKWVVNEAACFPQIGAARLRGLLDDMERRFLLAGSSMRAVHQYRALVSAKLGDMESARAWLVHWDASARDWLSDCAACDPDGRADLLGMLGDADGLIEGAERLIASRSRCGEIPHRTHGRVLAPLWRLGEQERAVAHHHTGYRMVRANPKLVEAHGQHIALAAAAGRDADAIAMLERHLEDALRLPAAWERMTFLTSVAYALRMLEAHGVRELGIRVPGRHEGALTPTDRLAAWAQAEADALISAFDARNGNTVIGDWCRQLTPG